MLNDKKKQEELGAVMRGQDLPTFNELDRELLAEYVKILKPVATCLDVVQSDDKAYMGVLLPHLRLMKDKLVTQVGQHHHPRQESGGVPA